MDNGILVAGSTFVDHYKYIETYPEVGMLSQIKRTERKVGGLVSNTGISLKKLNPNLEVSAFAGIGNDSDGEFLKNTLKSYNIDIKHIVEFQEEETGFTDAMTLETTGERTFFTYEGSNALLGPKNLKLNELNYGIAHFGYLLLMKQFDNYHEEYGTQLAFTLHQLQTKGIKTSIDLVSNDTPEFNKIVHPALKYCNYIIINEIEAELITEISSYVDGKINNEQLNKSMKKIFELGVKDLVVVHSPEGGWAMDCKLNFYHESSLRLEKGFIKNTVGAGDAFCAGALYSIYNNYDISYMLKFANAVAAMSLSESDSVSGIGTEDEVNGFLEERLKV